MPIKALNRVHKMINSKMVLEQLTLMKKVKNKMIGMIEEILMNSIRERAKSLKE